MRLNELIDNLGSRKSKNRVGRGIGSGKGKTSGRGHKGAKSRSGVSIKGFEGGQMPIYRRLPKRGFKNIFKVDLEIVNLGNIQQAIDSGKINADSLINIGNLRNSGLVKDNDKKIKILAKGNLTTTINIEVDAASASAIKAVEKTGGKVTILNSIGTKSKLASKESQQVEKT
tara:strand:+ start:628 stop:1143 length:516 start_codon:yes stop_codon:yes gene_type:complete